MAVENYFMSMGWSFLGVAFTLLLYRLIYVPFHMNQDRDSGIKVDRKVGPRKSYKKKCNSDVKGTRPRFPCPYPNGWYAITYSEDIAVEQVKSFDFLGTRVAVFRNDKGQVNVLDAFCPHLGADIGIGGKVRGDCVECPFHHWSFRGADGKCTNIAYSKTEIPKNATLNKWVSGESNGYIYAWYHAESEEPWPLPHDPRIENKELVCHGGNELWVNCHIQEIPENGADAAHLMAVHSDTVLSGGETGHRNWLWSLCGSHGWEATWRQDDSENKRHIAYSQLKQYLRFFNKYRLFDVDVLAEQIGPGIVMLHLNSSIGHFTVVQTVTPVAPLLQRVNHRFYAKRELFLPAKLLVYGETIMVKRDIEMWNNKQYMENPCLVREDRFIKSYRMWFKQFYTENSITYKEATESLDW